MKTGDYVFMVWASSEWEDGPKIFCPTLEEARQHEGKYTVTTFARINCRTYRRKNGVIDGGDGFYPWLRIASYTGNKRDVEKWGDVEYVLAPNLEDATIQFALIDLDKGDDS